MGNNETKERAPGRIVPEVVDGAPLRLYRDEFLWKIPVVGDIGSGKSSLLKICVLLDITRELREDAELVNNIFSINYHPTNRLEFFLKQIQRDQNTLVRVQFWDVSGSERYGTSTRMFYQGALGAVVVLDISKHSSLKEAAMWASDIQSKVTLGEHIKFPIILLANKMDLLDPARKQKLSSKLDVLAVRNGFLGWWMTSAKDSHNIERPFEVLFEKIFSLNNVCPLILNTKIVPRDEDAENLARARILPSEPVTDKPDIDIVDNTENTNVGNVPDNILDEETITQNIS